MKWHKDYSEVSKRNMQRDTFPLPASYLPDDANELQVRKRSVILTTDFREKPFSEIYF